MKSGGQICLWDLSTGNRLQTFDLKASRAILVDLSPDGRLAAAAAMTAGGRTARIWNVGTAGNSKSRTPLTVARADA